MLPRLPMHWWECPEEWCSGRGPSLSVLGSLIQVQRLLTCTHAHTMMTLVWVYSCDDPEPDILCMLAANRELLCKVNHVSFLFWSTQYEITIRYVKSLLFLVESTVIVSSHSCASQTWSCSDSKRMKRLGLPRPQHRWEPGRCSQCRS